MKRIFITLLITLLVVTLPTLSIAGMYRQVDTGEALTLERILSDLQTDRVLLIGEQHQNKEHHRLQLAVIQALHQQGVRIAIGMEMFYADNQGVLDAWIAGTIRPDLFQMAFEQQWNGWDAYADILFFARDQQIPLVGLNLPRSIVRQVSRQGFDALPDKIRTKTGQVRCVVTPEYGKLLRAVFANPKAGHSDRAFTNFCEAQMMWDTYMAQSIERYLASNPERLMVVIAGSVHSWRQGIPRQFQQDLPHKVLLPSAPGFRALDDLTLEDADYTWQPSENPLQTN